MEFREEQGDSRQNSAVENGQRVLGSAGIPGRNDHRKLFVGGLSFRTTEHELKKYFSKFGVVDNVVVKHDLYSGQPRGFAFIVFEDRATIDKLLAFGEHYINQKKVDPKRMRKNIKHGQIFVGSLTPEISDNVLRDYFSQFGTVVEIQSPYDIVQNKRKNYCFITFESKKVAMKLLKKPKQIIEGKEVDVRKVRVKRYGVIESIERNQLLGLGRGSSWSVAPVFPQHAAAVARGRFRGGFNNNEYSRNKYDGTAPAAFGAASKPRGGRPFQRHWWY